jgi:anti-sigma factor (TIGR02949 family)
MVCAAAPDQLSAWVDGELDPSERQQVQAHLAQCPECAREVDVLRRLSALLGQIQAATPPPDFRSRLMARLLQREKDRQYLYVLTGMNLSWTVGPGPPAWLPADQSRPVLNYEEYARVPRPAAGAEEAVRFVVPPYFGTGEQDYGSN